MSASRWFWHSSFLLLLTALGMLLVIVGLLVIFDFPARLEAWGLWTPLGIIGIAFGEFLFAYVAGELFPRADWRIAGALQVAPWLAVVVAMTMIIGIVVTR